MIGILVGVTMVSIGLISKSIFTRKENTMLNDALSRQMTMNDMNHKVNFFEQQTEN